MVPPQDSPVVKESTQAADTGEKVRSYLHVHFHEQADRGGACYSFFFLLKKPEQNNKNPRTPRAEELRRRHPVTGGFKKQSPPAQGEVSGSPEANNPPQKPLAGVNTVPLSLKGHGRAAR